MTLDGPGQIVVTGTAGRASIATMIAVLLHARGDRVLQINGHWLHSPLEQIAIDGASLTPETIDSMGLQYEPGANPNVDALRAQLLEQPGWDWLVVGGVDGLARQAMVAVVAPILPIAGATAAEQAAALLGRLAPAPVVVSAPQRESVLDVLRPYAETRGSSLIEVAASCRLARERSDLDGQEFRLKTEMSDYRLRLPVLGSFQIENTATAVVAVECALIAKAAGKPLDLRATRTALESLRLPGCCELIKRRPFVIVDAASGPGSLGRVAEFLRSSFSGRNLEIIVDVGSAIEPAEFVNLLAALQPEIVVAGAADSSGWLAACAEAGVAAQRAINVTIAVEAALEAADPGDVLVVLGSRKAAAAARVQVLALLPPDLRLN
jgi:dihydrofolate synthase/folylpolyglutamate synthase